MVHSLRNVITVTCQLFRGKKSPDNIKKCIFEIELISMHYEKVALVRFNGWKINILCKIRPSLSVIFFPSMLVKVPFYFPLQ